MGVWEYGSMGVRSTGPARAGPTANRQLPTANQYATIHRSGFMALPPLHPGRLHRLDGDPRGSIPGTPGLLRTALRKGKNTA